MDSLAELSLFSGYGGFTLGLRLSGVAVQTVCYVEWDKYCQRLIQARITDGYLDDAPIWDDITTFDGRPWRGHVDIITGGFPCQPHSNAGKRLGREDKRNLWPDTCRIIREVGPRYVLLENVRGLADGANPFAAEVIGSLSEVGYDAVWGLHSAAQAGAPHLRWRWWCLAYPSRSSIPQQHRWGRWESREGETEFTRDGQDGSMAGSYPEPDRERQLHGEPQQHSAEAGGESLGDVATMGGDVADASQSGLETGRFSSRQKQTLSKSAHSHQRSWWRVEPQLGRVADGYPDGLDILRTFIQGAI